MASRNSTSLNLPEEIIEEVLSRVPVKGLLKFRCVSKSWHCLIDSEQFKKAQLEKSRKNTGFLEHRLIIDYYGVHQCRLQSLLNGACLDRIYKPCEGYNVVGSFNGLVCLEKDKHFILWNPSTRIINRLPEIDSVVGNGNIALSQCGMGWFESSGEYKIFAVVVPDYSGYTDFEGKVYSSKTNSWKTIMLEDSNMEAVYENVGQFVSGKLHWVMLTREMEYDRFVVSFDLKSEVFGLIELPFKPNSWCDFYLGVLGGYLCTLNYEYHCGRVVDVWVMKEYGVKESWQKLEPPFPASAQFVQQENGELGELLMFFGNAFLVYSPTESVFHEPHMAVLAYSISTLLCIDTLVSPILHR